MIGSVSKLLFSIYCNINILKSINLVLIVFFSNLYSKFGSIVSSLSVKLYKLRDKLRDKLYLFIFFLLLFFEYC